MAEKLVKRGGATENFSDDYVENPCGLVYESALSTMCHTVDQ